MQVFNHTKGLKEAALECFRDLPIRHMRVLNSKFQTQVLVQTLIVQVRKVPHSCKSFQVLETDEHTETSMPMRV